MKETKNTPEKTEKFNLNVEIPKFGKIHIELCESTWNSIMSFSKKHLPWLATAFVCGGAIGANVLPPGIAPGNLPSPPPPITRDLPSQPK